MSVQVKLNGEPRDLPDGSTVAQAVAELTAATPLRDGDQVEVVTAVQGG